MAEGGIHQIDKKTWNKWAFYVNIIVFIIVAVSCVFLIKDAYEAGTVRSTGGDALAQAMLEVARDAVFLAICLTYIFIQLFRYQRVIARRSW